MGNIQAYNKFWVAAIMAILAILNQQFGIVTPSFLTEGNVTMIIAAIMPVLVWAVPNKVKA